ncbi:MAG TPA: hypothetical protein VGG64_11210 [Pirellulales bacterium]|jgi:hypothetical protein
MTASCPTAGSGGQAANTSHNAPSRGVEAIGGHAAIRVTPAHPKGASASAACLLWYQNRLAWQVEILEPRSGIEYHHGGPVRRKRAMG